VAILAGCVAVHAPLRRDPSYPVDWPEPAALGPECEALAGSYSNAGVVGVAGGELHPVALAEILNVPGTARRISLAVRTRKVDRHGDTFATLDVDPEGGSAQRGSLPDCFCIRQVLACTKVTESSWRIPNLGVGGRQTNVYLSVAADGSLIARLQDYRIDVVFLLPLYGIKEPWARFAAGDPP
jgi:hypothetical protein